MLLATYILQRQGKKEKKEKTYNMVIWQNLPIVSMAIYKLQINIISCNRNAFQQFFELLTGFRFPKLNWEMVLDRSLHPWTGKTSYRNMSSSREALTNIHRSLFSFVLL